MFSQSSPSPESNFQSTANNNSKENRLQNLKTIQITSEPEFPISALEKLSYTKLGRVSYFESRPSIVHFGGYEVNSVSSQTLNITNVGAVPKRLLIVQPTTPFFTLRFEKTGVVAPGE